MEPREIETSMTERLQQADAERRKAWDMYYREKRAREHAEAQWEAWQRKATVDADEHTEELAVMYEALEVMAQMLRALRVVATEFGHEVAGQIVAERMTFPKYLDEDDELCEYGTDVLAIVYFEVLTRQVDLDRYVLRLVDEVGA